MLDLTMQATELPGPITRWGSIARSSPMAGTYHFYTDDYKFSALQNRPDQMVRSGCRVAIEPNYSTWPGMAAERLDRAIASKRAIARYWQSQGVRIVVDLSVDPLFREANLAGVPPGWRAFAVRQQAGISDAEIESDWRAATLRAGTEDILFCVFGGWKRMRDLCADRGWTWVAEDLHRARGSTDGTRRWK